MPLVDVVVVSYNSRERLRAAVEPLARREDVRVVVVDNASADGSLEAVADLPVSTIRLPENVGFAAGANAGWRAGASPYVLLLNPDAALDAVSLSRLTAVLDAEAGVALAAPKISGGEGRVQLSQRRFPRLRSTYAQALFLHRLFPRAQWTDELVRDPAAYERPGSPDWVSGACMLVRRTALERVGGLDDGFFLYCEDIDLCRRLRDAGFDLRYEPGAVTFHEGGASAPRPSLLPVLAASRIRYAAKHRSRPAALLERLGVALGALTHMAVSSGGRNARAGHVRSLRVALSATSWTET